jgi:elongation factor 2
VKLEVSSPRVVYCESVTKEGVKAAAASPNKRNRFVVQVKPIEEEIAAAGNLPVVEEDGNVLSMDEHRNVLLDCSGKTEKLEEDVLEAVIAGFEFACRAGPMCGEPLRHVRVQLLDLQLSEETELRGSVEIMRAVGKAIFGSFLTAKPVLLEPVYRMIVSMPVELSGECSRIIETKRGRVRAFEQRGGLTVLTAFIPVSETFGLSKLLRSATSGRAFWQSVLDSWELVPEKLAVKVIAEIRARKGLSVEVPDASKFLGEG